MEVTNNQTSPAITGVLKPADWVFDLKPISYVPILLFIIFAATLAFPPTREATMWVLDENKPVEVITFLVMMAAGAYGLKLVWDLFKQEERIGYMLFYFLFAAGMIFTGMEEIAWGQQFWGFATPDSLNAINMQQETTIHNIKGFHGNTEVFRLLFGLGGLVGIALAARGKLLKIATPLVLVTWFLVIAGHSAIDVFDDIVAVPKFMEAATSQLAELNELVISIAAFLYLFYNRRSLFGGNE